LSQPIEWLMMRTPAFTSSSMACAQVTSSSKPASTSRAPGAMSWMISAHAAPWTLS
jgi:hypothetical protein